MTRSTYSTHGGVIFVEEHRPITVEKAEAMRAVHLHNVAMWLGRLDLSPAARLAVAKIEQELADEMAACIRALSPALQEAEEIGRAA